ncbi:hypothetical protein OS493_022958 [Desmophyllum pertusum]|uniref:Adhesin-like protein n=1 Tax=Desmophyllum pertusum TaxID=174260 RepID=A0A9W9ZCE0_9CNID|nr:hypothetical protein OS493_022958 [Desmophyllum pertusum]
MPPKKNKESQGTKGKGKRPAAKASKADDNEPKSKKVKKESSDPEESNDGSDGEGEIDFACTTTDKKWNFKLSSWNVNGIRAWMVSRVSKGTKLYISRASGDDRWSCDDQAKPCKTIWRAVTLATRGSGYYHIHLDGTNTERDPYNCIRTSTDTSHHPGIYINKSLSLIGFGLMPPRIRCSEGTNLTFDGSDNAQQMEVSLSGLLLKESFVYFQDSSAKIDGCKFEGSKQGLQFVIGNKMVSNIQIINSTFVRNSKCISVFINSTRNVSQTVQVIFKLKNTSFDLNTMSDEGSCMSFRESPDNNQSVSCNITLEDVRFSQNTFGSRGLVFLELENGNQNIHLQDVAFINNSPLSGRDVLTGYDHSECIFCSNIVDVFANANTFTSQNARSFNVIASNISLQIYNSTFCDHKVDGNGGVISVSGADLCKLNVFNSSFVNTSASQGGVFDIECAKVNLSFQDNIFTNNTAVNGGGGSLYVNTSGPGLNNSEFGTNDEARLDGNSVQLLQMNVTKCAFSNAYGASGGGAVYINALKASVHLHHTTFTNCSVLAWGGGGVFIKAGLMSRKRKSGNNLVLVVESCRFIDCRTGLWTADGGSLKLLYQTKIEISINNSHIISSYAGTGGALSIRPSSIENTDEPMASHITIRNSTFSNNRAVQTGGAIYLTVNNRSTLILQNVVMESNSVKGATFGTYASYEGGAISIDSPIFALRVLHSRFLKNTVASNGSNVEGLTAGGALFISDVHILEVKDSHFDGNYAGNFTSVPDPTYVAFGGALYIKCGVMSISNSIVIINTTFNSCAARGGGGAIYLVYYGNISLVIERSRFVDNFSFSTGGGAISLIQDIEKNGVCFQQIYFSASQINDAEEVSSRAYKSQVSFEDTIFETNAGYMGGAIYLYNGKATFINCLFVDNFSSLDGGHIYFADSLTLSASLIIQGSRFLQTRNELHLGRMKYRKASFIQSEICGLVKVLNTTMDVRAYGSANPMMLIVNAGIIEIPDDKLTNQNAYTLEFSCLACTGNSYSLQRGEALVSQLVPGFQCVPCPFGANCTQNIVSKLNFWGFQEQDNPPTLRFIMCPVGYCSPPRIADFPEYNGCQGNRSGELCGHCKEGYMETLYSTHCRPSHQCNDNWFWPLAVLYVSLMALYFTFKPPIVPWIKRQILCFTKHEPANQDDNLDKGYLKILFYFYQAANLLLVSNSSQSFIKAYLAEPIVGLFNFKFFSSGLICPFPGLTVVTKQLFSASHVFWHNCS